MEKKVSYLAPTTKTRLTKSADIFTNRDWSSWYQSRSYPEQNLVQLLAPIWEICWGGAVDTLTATPFHRGNSRYLTSGVGCRGAVNNFTPTSFHRCKSQVLALGVGCSGAVDNFTPTSFQYCESQLLFDGIGCSAAVIISHQLHSIAARVKF